MFTMLNHITAYFNCYVFVVKPRTTLFRKGVYVRMQALHKHRTPYIPSVRRYVVSVIYVIRFL